METNIVDLLEELWIALYGTDEEVNELVKRSTSQQN